MTNLESLVSDIEFGKSLVLFCGAGINCDDKVNLGWSALIEQPFKLALNHICREKNFDNEFQDLLYRIFDMDKSKNGIKMDNKDIDLYELMMRANAEFPFEIRTSILKRVHGNKYIPLLKSYIYNQCNKTLIRKSFHFHYAKRDKYKSYPEQGYELPNKDHHDQPSLHSLYILAKFILLYEKLEAVVTYNYDNFLTMAVKVIMEEPELFFYKPEYEQLKRKWQNIGKDQMGQPFVKVVDIDGDNFRYSLGKHDIAVFHVHGFIPPPNKTGAGNESSIVLSLDEYCDSINYQQKWQNATQMHYLCHCTCLFAGSSMTDLTVKRMISLAQQQGNDENIYNLDCTPVNNTEYDGKIDMKKTGLHMLGMLRHDYLSDVGVKPISYPGRYLDLYEELGKIIYLKSAGKLKSYNNNPT